MSDMLSELLTKQEPLHEDLVNHITERPLIGKLLHHPLVIHPLYSEQRNAFINAQYLMKLEMLSNAIKENNFSSYVFLHERPYRLDALISVIRNFEISSQNKNELIKAVWIDSENIYENLDVWCDLWEHTNRNMIMSSEDKAFLETLPDEITIYRGFDSVYGTEDGLSWSLKKSKANEFSIRYGKKNPVVLKKKVLKKDILAYINDRNEYEIVVFPDCVY